MLAQRAPTLQQPQLQQRQLPPQLQQQRQPRLPFLGAHASAAGALLLQQPQQLPAFWSGLISSRGGLVPYPLQVCVSLCSTLCAAHFPVHEHFSVCSDGYRRSWTCTLQILMLSPAAKPR